LFIFWQKATKIVASINGMFDFIKGNNEFRWWWIARLPVAQYKGEISIALNRMDNGSDSDSDVGTIG
jgi:hypothetical protein